MYSLHKIVHTRHKHTHKSLTYTLDMNIQTQYKQTHSTLIYTPDNNIYIQHKHIRTIQSLPNSLLCGQDSAETVRRPQAKAPFQHCPDRIIVNLVGIVLCIISCPAGWLISSWPPVEPMLVSISLISISIISVYSCDTSSKYLILHSPAQVLHSTLQPRYFILFSSPGIILYSQAQGLHSTLQPRYFTLLSSQVILLYSPAQVLFSTLQPRY